jgi:hypothetical protein
MASALQYLVLEECLSATRDNVVVKYCVFRSFSLWYFFISVQYMVLEECLSETRDNVVMKYCVFRSLSLWYFFISVMFPNKQFRALYAHHMQAIKFSTWIHCQIMIFTGFGFLTPYCGENGTADEWKWSCVLFYYVWLWSVAFIFYWVNLIWATFALEVPILRWIWVLRTSEEAPQGAPQPLV